MSFRIYLKPGENRWEDEEWPSYMAWLELVSGSFIPSGLKTATDEMGGCYIAISSEEVAMHVERELGSDHIEKVTMEQYLNGEIRREGRYRSVDGLVEAVLETRIRGHGEALYAAQRLSCSGPSVAGVMAIHDGIREGALSPVQDWGSGVPMVVRREDLPVCG